MFRYLLLFLISFSFAANDGWEIFSNFKENASIVSNYDITNYDDKNQSYDHQKGLFYYDSKYGSKWETKNPYIQTIWISHKELVVYDQALNQVTKQNFAKLDFDSPARLLSTDIETLQKKYNLKFESNRLVFEPKSESDLFKRVEIVFHNNQLEKITIVDKIDYKCVMTLNMLNKKPKPSDFQIKYPKDVEIIE